jgi:hypothetical protein
MTVSPFNSSREFNVHVSKTCDCDAKVYDGSESESYRRELHLKPRQTYHTKDVCVASPTPYSIPYLLVVPDLHGQTAFRNGSSPRDRLFNRRASRIQSLNETETFSGRMVKTARLSMRTRG